MPEIRTSPEVDRFIEAHPDVGAVELLLPDLNGVLRGKRIPVRDVGRLFDAGVPFPLTAQLVDSRGSLVDGLPHGWRDGDPDGVFRPVPGSLAGVPWADGALAQCLGTLEAADGTAGPGDSRSRLAMVVGRFAELGLTPVVAVEYEFFLLEAGSPPRARTGQVPGTRHAAAGPRVYSVEDLHDLDSFFAAVTAACAAQGIPAGSIVSEYGAGQFEVNLEHVADPLRAADHAVLLRRVVRGAARRFGLAATFMAKPFADSDGSGMHLHVSLLDANRKNVFSGDRAEGPGGGTPALRHAVGGMLATMRESFAMFAPNANSYRRFRPDCFAPVAANWGANHRHVAIRLPPAEPDNTRFEHRVAGADCNPYLAIAAILAGVHHGITNRLEPPPIVPEGLPAPAETLLPVRWQPALDAFDAAAILPRYLGADFCRLYGAVRRFEADAYHAAVPDLDYAWYLPSL